MKYSNCDCAPDDSMVSDANNFIAATKVWAEYKKYLMKKYPPVEGKEFEFTCEHHKKLDKILG